MTRFSHCCRTGRRGMILLVVLVVISVLALISVSFSYRMDAERMAVRALEDIQQARFAAESGVTRALLLLRDERTNVASYYNNPASFRRVPVWMPDDQGGFGGSEADIHKLAVPNEPCWRYSVVSYERESEDKVVIRYGLTDEASKININQASRGELLRLVKAIEPYLGETPPEALVDCLLDWRTEGDTPITPAGAKTPWYMNKLGYACKNRPFDSVEELLMVKHWNAALLYGEDANRNGYMDENEDDGEDGAYPPDNGDAVLNRGLLPYITVYSWDWDSANDNKLRADINSFPWDKLESGELPRQYDYLKEELTSETIQFLAEARKRGHKFRSIGELWGLEVYEDGSSNLDGMWIDYDTQVELENALPKSEGEEAAEKELEGESDKGGKDQGGDKEGAEKEQGDEGKSGADKGGKDKDEKDEGTKEEGGKNGNIKEDNTKERNPTDEEGKHKTRKPIVSAGVERKGLVFSPMPSIAMNMRSAIMVSVLAQHNPGDDNVDNRDSRDRNRSGGRNDRFRDGPGGDDARANDRPPHPGDSNDRHGGRDRGRTDVDTHGGTEGEGTNQDNGRDGSGKTGDNATSGGKDGDKNGGKDGGKDSAGQPESDMDKGARRGTGVQFPQNAEQMHVLMDRLTVHPVAKTRGKLPGLINVNTAPMEVLRTIIGLTDEDAAAIVARRKGMQATELRTPAWLVTTGTVSPEKFAVISNKLTTRSLQFSADVIGFADHVGTYKRLQVMIEMQGHIAQVRYYRDISSLGIGYPVKDDERSEGLAYQPQ